MKRYQIYKQLSNGHKAIMDWLEFSELRAAERAISLMKAQGARSQFCIFDNQSKRWL